MVVIWDNNPTKLIHLETWGSRALRRGQESTLKAVPLQWSGETSVIPRPKAVLPPRGFLEPTL